MTEELTFTEISAETINANFTAAGNAINSKADLNGDCTKKFKVANAEESKEAINKEQFDSLITAINSEITELETDVSAKADKTYVDNHLALKANIVDVNALLATKADLNGNINEAFNVADAVNTTEAVNKGQLDSAVSGINNRIWISGEYQPVSGAATVAYHNLNLTNEQILRCDWEILLKCVIPELNYSVGDVTTAFASCSGIDYVVKGACLSTNTICTSTGTMGIGIFIHNKANGNYSYPTLANWRYVFRIRY